jgi:HTH-type transcriptional regulator/antitoxin HigA
MLYRIIHTERHYKRAIEELERLMDHPDAEKPGRIGDDLELLAMLIEKFEEERFPIAPTSPGEVLRFVMEQRGLAQKDLAPLFGGKARVSDFFAGRRGLSVSTIVALHQRLKIPVELLIDRKARRKPRGRAGRHSGAERIAERSTRYAVRRRPK